jgi:4-amino-4-deoxy-L-arabinose transferase-like glycosyltransferase
MSLIMRLTGSDSEAPLHAGFVIFPMIAGISMYFLARKFTTSALAAALLFLVTPAVMVLSHTLMADVPMIAIWMAATALYIYGVDRDDLRLLVLAGIAAALAILTGYQALALILLLPAYPLLLGKLSWKNAVPLLIPVAVFGLYSLASLWQYGELPRFSHTRGTSFEADHLLDRIEGMLLHTGGVTIFPLALAGLFSIRRKRFLVLPLTVGVAIALGLHQHQTEDLLTAATIIYIVLIAAATTLLINLISETVIQFARAINSRTVDTSFLFLAFWLLFMMGAIVIVLPHVTAKYTLVFMAPLVLLAFRELEFGVASRAVVKAVIAITIALTLLAGTALSVADFRLAASNRDFVATVGDRYQTDGTVWFVGEWGFRHYMEAAGYRYLSSADDTPASGDLIISPKLADWPLAPSVAGMVEQLDMVTTEWSWPLRLMSFEADAGFYGTYWGLLPYSWGDVPVESFDVLIVGPMVEPEEGA